MKHTFKIGDKVRVRKDLVVGKLYGTEVFLPSMKKYIGKVFTISYVGNWAYELEETKHPHLFSPQTLEPYKETRGRRSKSVKAKATTIRYFYTITQPGGQRTIPSENNSSDPIQQILDSKPGTKLITQFGTEYTVIDHKTCVTVRSNNTGLTNAFGREEIQNSGLKIWSPPTPKTYSFTNKTKEEILKELEKEKHE